MATGPHMTYGCLPSGVAGRDAAGGQTALNRKKRGFTLVEIMIVVVIIGLLAAMALPTFRRVTLRSQASRLANDFRQFESAFERYCLQSGSWPPATGMGIIPAGMEGLLPDSYTQTSPLGGQYLWTGPGQDVVLRGTFATDELMESVDKTLDDGNLTTGDFTKLSDGTFGFHAH